MSCHRVIEPEVVHQDTVAAHDPPGLKTPSRLFISVGLFMITTVMNTVSLAPHLVVIEGVSVRQWWWRLDISHYLGKILSKCYLIPSLPFWSVSKFNLHL